MLRNAPIYHEELARLRHADVLSEAHDRGIEERAARSADRPSLPAHAGATFAHVRAALTEAISSRRHPPSRPVPGH